MKQTKKDIEELNGSWDSYYKGVMAGKKDDGYVTINDETDLFNYIVSKLGDVVVKIDLIEKGLNFPDNMSDPYYRDIYTVYLVGDVSFKIIRIYGRPKWSGNVGYSEALEVSDIKLAN